MKKILIAYASRHGSTREIAEVIGRKLRKANFEVHISTVEDVESLIPYDAVILGSAVYASYWMAKAVDFLKANARALSNKHVWLFSSGPTGNGDPEMILGGWHFPTNLYTYIEEINPHDIMLFHGCVDVDKLEMGEKLMFKATDSPFGDFRDWDVIGTWAEGIGDWLLYKHLVAID